MVSVGVSGVVIDFGVACVVVFAAVLLVVVHGVVAAAFVAITDDWVDSKVFTNGVGQRKCYGLVLTHDE